MESVPGPLRLQKIFKALYKSAEKRRYFRQNLAINRGGII